MDTHWETAGKNHYHKSNFISLIACGCVLGPQGEIQTNIHFRTFYSSYKVKSEEVHLCRAKDNKTMNSRIARFYF